MKNYVSTEDLKQIDSNLSFVIRGIEEHLSNDNPNPEQIISALTLISNSLFGLIKDAENENA